MSEEQIKHMAERFLQWKLPQPLRPDNGISYTPYVEPDDVNYEARRPRGTNLWGYSEAVEMVRHMIEDLPSA